MTDLTGDLHWIELDSAQRGIKVGGFKFFLHSCLHSTASMSKRSGNESGSDTEFSRSDQETDSEDEKVVKKERVKKAKNVGQKEKDKKASAKAVNQPRKRKAGEILFDELRADVDLSNENVSSKRIKLASNLMLESKIVEIKDENNKKYSYPALVFMRKSKDGKIFEFNVPTILSHKLCEAVKTLVIA